MILTIYMFNFISLTAISRDGKDALFMKQIPISLEKQIFYKILPGILLNIIPTIYIVVFEKILINAFQLKLIFSIFMISTLMNIFNNYIMILIDLKNPKLDWSSEYAVVKQNINMFFQFIIILIECGILIPIGAYLKLEIGEIILSITFIIGIILVRNYIRKNQNKIFNKIN